MQSYSNKSDFGMKHNCYIKHAYVLNLATILIDTVHNCAFVSAECPAECESCVNIETCTRCRPGLYQLSGRCHHVCPEDYEPNDKLVECTPQGQSRVCLCVCVCGCVLLVGAHATFLALDAQ